MNSLKAQIIYPLLVFVALLGIGTLVFNALEGWSYLDALYFSVVTMATVGYGDFTPTHDLSKVITMIYAVSGISFFLYFVSFMANLYMERSREALQRTLSTARIPRFVTNLKLRPRGLKPRFWGVKDINEVLEETDAKIEESETGEEPDIEKGA